MIGVGKGCPGGECSETVARVRCRVRHTTCAGTHTETTLCWLLALFFFGAAPSL